MEYSNASTEEYYYRSVSPPSGVSSSSCSQSPPPPAAQLVGNVAPTVVMSPCAACKILRRRCADGCVLAPYFPPTEPAKFTTAHRVFGASNIIKLLQDLPESSRADAVSSMVYEAEARLRDPVYGCAGAVCRLQRQANELKVQLARAQADLLNAQAQHANLLALLCVDVANRRVDRPDQQQQQQETSPPMMDSGSGSDVGGGAGYHHRMFYDDADLLDSATWPDHEAQLWT
ncbi:hypothetical protein PR202_ga26102 [Eleusine coracana subsp. coracana]|uniref:LOB domain-containing protein n=1 Tax=Eleusine coracana subsp. coracana TaxID=191504 RepID=A0AAV5DCF0_ELECO|nr:hypothetical protein QOZ80_3AG0244000 [Eleusine coracana subsp. coracana]GJN08207.1 hypothetical protein PR202_ga26102 [Eleusine coracana subsp. coracana]